MMIKIEKETGWALYDHIRLADHYVIRRDQPYGLQEGTEDYTYYLPPSVERSIVSLSLTHDDGKERHILAYSPVYILNDAGRTVERI